jgi:hypothetical protein
MKRTLSLLASALALAGARPALAEEPTRPHAPLPGSDGVYGRMEGLLALAADVGAEVEDGEPRGSLRVSAHYLWIAGAYARYSDAFGGAQHRPSRVASLGVDLRPLFLPRFSQDWERGPALLDLGLDSLSLSAGAYFAEPRERSFGDERGFELGAGFGLPLAGRAEGPWLDFRAERRFADEGDSVWLLTASLGYHLLTWSTDSGRP